ncbi:MAG: DUF5131 family protein [Hungatella hathewayi]|nr:DUF5131 family protein [Hungatella hathewayi]
MAVWNPWRGCHRHSEGCKYCYACEASRRVHYAVASQTHT